MNRESRPHVLDLNYTAPHHRSRSTTSINSEYAMSINGPMVSTLLMEVMPEAAFIAPAAATQIVTSNCAGCFDSVAVVSAGAPTIPVTPQSLRLLNQFLDFLLYSILSTAKATTLSALRPAVTTILKARFAAEAIAEADGELQSYLGGEIDDLEGGPWSNDGESPEWDLEATWRKARVRCMVYCSLGDLEDDAIYSQGDDGQDENDAYSVVSPAVAIWLTAILERVGGQTLSIAGKATVARYAAARQGVEGQGVTNSVGRPMVEELDAEKVALSPSLGRIWRQWRNQVRGVGSPTSFSTSDAVFQRLERGPGTPSRKGGEYTDKGTPPPLLPQTVPVPVPAPVSTPKVDKAIDAVPTGINSPPELEKSEKSGSESLEDTDDEKDSKNPLTPIWETGSNAGDDMSETTEFEDADIEIGTWIVKPREERRPRSLIIFPWTIGSQFEFSMDFPSHKRPRSLPPIDTTFELDEEPVEVSSPSGYSQALSPTSTIPADSENLEETRAQMDELMERMKTVVTSEQAKIQEGNALDGYDVPVEIHPGESAIAAAIQRGHAAVPLAQDLFTEYSKDLESEIGIAKTSNLIYPVNGRQVQCITVPRSSGSQKRAAKRRALRAEPLEIQIPSNAGQGKMTRNLSAVSNLSALSNLSAVSTSSDPFSASKYSARTPDSRENTEAASTSSEDEATLVPLNSDGTRSTPARKSSLANTVTTANTSNFLSSVPSLTHSKHNSTSNASFRHQFNENRRPSCPTLQAPPRTPTPSDRAGRVIVRTSPSSFDELRPSSSFGKGQRNIHTSHSAHSATSTKFKNLIAWPDSAKRGDSDDACSLRSEKLISKAEKLDEKERSFEELIRREQTIRCTITPTALEARELSTTTDLADYLRSAGPNGLESPRPPFAKNSNKPAVPRVPVSLARDARAVPDDSKDLALFLRGTGPAEGPNPPRSHSSYSSNTTSTRSTSKMANSGAYPKALHRPLIVTPPSTASSPFTTSSPFTSIPNVMSSPRLSSTSNNRVPQKRFIPREASGSSGDVAAALADFFRTELPPDSLQNGAYQHRIPRTVAPFRTTMDSVQFDMASNVSPMESNFSVAADSYQSSAASTTGLLGSTRRNDDIARPVLPKPVNMDGPARKQTRARDPYEIDYDDDYDLDEYDEDEYCPPPPPAKKREESLADFLRNAPPPPPLQSSNTSHSMSDFEAKRVPKKNSATSLMTRFTRAPARKNSLASPIEKTPYRPIIIPSAAEGYTPSIEQNVQGFLTTAPAATKLTKRQPDAESFKGSSSGNRVGPRPMAGGASRVGSGSAGQQHLRGSESLADFLRTSAPPPPPNMIGAGMREEAAVATQSKAKSMSLFGRKSKRKESLV
ncbi:hypothetical protein DFH27DRAFT_521109 [Peziza echinospora]|nr:hypothetical protein DFH27DRAFT_521109 [Peziza echinospora]